MVISVRKPHFPVNKSFKFHKINTTPVVSIVSVLFLASTLAFGFIFSDYSFKYVNINRFKKFSIPMFGSLEFADLEGEDAEGSSNDLYPEILRDEAVARLNELGKISDADGYLERTFLSQGSIRAGNIIRSWMEDAGLTTWVDQLGNVHGRTEGMDASAEALLIGSHLDTVVDAGIFDGSLGIISALSALKILKIEGKLRKLRRPIEVIAFSDEEGVRFQSTFLGSAAIAGILPASALQMTDKSGVTVQDVIKETSIEITDENLLQIKYDPKSVWGYVEVHIEQGPVLESIGLPLGVVKGVAGQTRLKVTVRGSQGHAGTVPMSMRQDPMAAAAELIVLLESLCKRPDDFLSYDGQCSGFSMESFAGSLVCTVGEISCWPSASNVIPGQVTFTVDLRAMHDMGREAVIYELSKQMYQRCERRSVSCIIEHKHSANAVVCDTELSSRLNAAVNTTLGKMSAEVQEEVPVLMSGAGHDAMAMSHLTKVGMLFVRCRGGISHSPEEHVLNDDIWAAGLAILAFLETFV
ncbi:allantoate deiminase 2 isoform X2 [Malania oleifera]|uniref:allantoate deiminase 2 isoform X2 n=1 Tax=Malania oleifera TaxID=397392 RepID=UPI0025ADA4FE|nr:allantoate deiminase 2 isoform X2 [Malania oleifera]